jgi:hypothetical protein
MTRGPVHVQSLADARRLYPAPGNRRAYLHQPCDYKTVTARPDLKFQTLSATGGTYYRTGFGFVLLKGGRAVSFDFDRVAQHLEQGCLPLLMQQVAQDGFQFTLQSFTTQTGDGRPVIMLRLTVWRCAASPESVQVGFLAVRAPHERFLSHAQDDYIVFEPWGPAWGSPLPLHAESDCLHDGEYLFCVHRHSPGVTVLPPEAGAPASAAFHVAPGRDLPETVEITIPYECVARPADADDEKDEKDQKLDFRADQAFRVAERERLLGLSFDEQHERQARQWTTSHLARAARILVPETDVQDVYRTLTLNNLQFLGGSAGTTLLRPGQGGFNDFAVVYAWEASHYLTVMAKQGYRQELAGVLDYLLTTQEGHAGPQGDVTDADGSFRPFIHWMNETGAVLRIFAAAALTSGDFTRLRRDAAALLRAARWIQRQRRTTKETLAGAVSGPEKPLHYGLMPKGQPHDWPIFGYFLFTDTYLWQGLAALARAFAAAGLPEAAWLRDEADDYRRCILEAVRRAVKPHPLDPALTWVPSELYEEPAEALKTTIFCGPNSLIGSGILDASDELVPAIEKSLRAAGCMEDGFAFKMRLMEHAELRERQLASAGGHEDLYYVTFAEQPWHRVWIERGEREKATAFFYMTLAYALSRDLHMAQERFCPQLPWLQPWQPNGSANGRVLDMILASLCFAKGGACYLFHGAPDAWFDAGSPLGVEDLWIDGVRCSFRIEPSDRSNDAEGGSGRRGWEFSYKCLGGNAPERFILSLPDESGTGRRLKEVLTSGQPTGRCRV